MVWVVLDDDLETRVSFFKLNATDDHARAGTLRTAHGDVHTPTFMPVATQGSVKSVDPSDLRDAGSTMLLSNAYHLYLRPGVEVVKSLGGLHDFMGWSGPILTDSGGYQGFSLEGLRKITDDAIVFKSHIDGTIHTFTPEVAIECQEALGSDVIMPLDVCLPSGDDRRSVEEAVERTERWAIRSLKAHNREDQVLFGIVQGGLMQDLRDRSVSGITSLGLQGYAIGGLSVGESKTDLYKTAASTAVLLPEAAPRYLMGVGSPEDLVECVAQGIDMFDCVLPTRVARSGSLYVREGRVNIGAARFRKMEAPIDEGCDCATCASFSSGYLNHLFRAKELLAYRLGTIHNLRFVHRLMEEMRSAILNGLFAPYRRDFLDRFVPTDEELRRQQKEKWIESRQADA